MRLPAASDTYDPRDQAEFRRSVENALTMWGTPDELSPDETLDVRNFGVVGDGVADDTAAMQSALDAGYDQNRPVSGQSMTIKITGPLIMRGPGLVFNHVPNGGDGEGPGILVDGTGYTALTVIGIVHYFRVAIIGTGNTANGICLQNPQLSYFSFIRVVNLDGYGVRINSAWDCVFGVVSVELCGNATWYAWEINNGAAVTGSITMAASATGGYGGASAFTRASGSFITDGFAVGQTVTAAGFATGGNNGDTTITYLTATVMTVEKALTTNTAAAARTLTVTGDGSNMSHFQRLQVEQSSKKAMKVGDTTLSCVFDNIHSERLAADVSYTGWEFSGGACLFNGGRFHAETGTGKLWLRGIHNVFEMIRTESTVNTELEGASGYGITLIGPEFGGTTKETTGATGLISVVGGSLGTWSGTRLDLEFHQASWTPALKFGGGSTGMTYSAQSGTYTRNGKTIVATFDFTLNAKGSSTGAATITGLPYTVSGTHGGSVAFYVNLSGVANKGILLRADNGGTSLIPALSDADGAPTQCTDARFTDTSRVIGTITYQIA